jgi:hypothetical protein
VELVSRKYQGVQREFEVLTVEEAGDRGLELKPWRVAEPGEWALTDDGFACECLSRLRFNDGREYLEFSIAVRFPDVPQDLRWEDQKRTHSWTAFKPRTWLEDEMRRTRFKKLVNAYVTMYLNGKIDYSALGKLYRPTEKIPEASVKRILRQEEVKQLIDQEVEKALTSEGVTREYVIQLFKQAVALARENDDPAALLRAAENFADMLTMYPKQTKQVHTLETSESYTQQIGEEVRKAERTLRASNEGGGIEP